MSQLRRMSGGSRYLFEPFETAPQEVREAREKVLQMQFEGIDARLGQIETVMERLERRLWLIVYGVVGTIIAQAVRQIVTSGSIGGM